MYSYKKLSLFLFLTLLLFSAHSSLATVRLPHLFSNRMVLQRDTELHIWGWADPGEKITVRLSGKNYNAVTGATGEWSVTIPPQSYGGPYVLEVNEIVIRDVLIGDVWLCSGQSNQETPIVRLLDRFPEINTSNNHMIRHYKAPSKTSIDGEETDIPAGGVWYSANAVDVMNWTALAYFFAQEAYAKYGVPVGILNSSVGGTAIEGWISQENLKEFPQFTTPLAVLDSARRSMAANRGNMQAMPPQPVDQGIGKWSAETIDDSGWTAMAIPGQWADRGLSVSGTVWFRKNFEVPASMDGKHAKLILGRIIDSDSTFINGRFVGTVSYQYPPRKYDIPAGILHEGKNTIAVKIVDNSGQGGFVEDKTYKIIGDTEEINLAGDWKYKVGAEYVRPARTPAPANVNRNAPVLSRGSGYYNAMIAPVVNYKIKGAIWYQGEANAGNPGNYFKLLEALVTNWRRVWKMPDMPFLLVQLPNYMKVKPQPSESNWAKIREAQMKAALNIPNTALAVNYDVGEWNDIHPLNKKDVAHRVFLGARKLAYGEKNVVYSGPVFKEMKIEGNKIILSFTETGSGLMCDGRLKHFAVAGSDKIFVWAEAEIINNQVVVTCKSVEKPVAVRYAWADNPEGANLRNQEGLLASPFRTDNW
jgi:sialate O-acetylesterase